MCAYVCRYTHRGIVVMNHLHSLEPVQTHRKRTRMLWSEPLKLLFFLETISPFYGVTGTLFCISGPGPAFKAIECLRASSASPRNSINDAFSREHNYENWLIKWREAASLVTRRILLYQKVELTLNVLTIKAATWLEDDSLSPKIPLLWFSVNEPLTLHACYYSNNRSAVAL